MTFALFRYDLTRMSSIVPVGVLTP
uniref:Uncharacterized protein n=1 Tax=Anguilla anguilla TaxID=7936 RepID=A0A0E9RPY3_ANGAN